MSTNIISEEMTNELLTNAKVEVLTKYVKELVKQVAELVEKTDWLSDYACSADIVNGEAKIIGVKDLQGQIAKLTKEVAALRGFEEVEYQTINEDGTVETVRNIRYL